MTANRGEREKLVKRITRCPFSFSSFSFPGPGGELTIPSIRHISKPLRLHGYGDQIREGPPVRTGDVASNENISTAYTDQRFLSSPGLFKSVFHPGCDLTACSSNSGRTRVGLVKIINSKSFPLKVCVVCDLPCHEEVVF